jgi:hypothetical protein
MGKLWLAGGMLLFLATCAGVTIAGGLVTSDWDYPLGTGLKRLGVVALNVAFMAVIASVICLLRRGWRTRIGRDEAFRWAGSAFGMGALVLAILAAVSHADGFDVWSGLPGEPSWLVSSLARANPHLEIEEGNDGELLVDNDRGDRVSFWPWQVKGARVDWRSCQPADLPLLGAVQPEPGVVCAHFLRVRGAAEPFARLVFHLGDHDPEAVATAWRKDYEGLGGRWLDHTTQQQGGVRRRIDFRRTRRSGNWLYVDILDASVPATDGPRLR